MFTQSWGNVISHTRIESPMEKQNNIQSSLVVMSKNKPKMAYSCDLPKMARQQCGIMD